LSTTLQLRRTPSRETSSIGACIDMVAARGDIITAERAAKIPGRRWKPVHHATTHLRAPQPGMLDTLIGRHAAFIGRITEAGFAPVPPLDGFRIVAYDDIERINRRPYAAFNLLPIDPGDNRPRKSFAQTDADHVAAMLRHAACQAATNDLADWRDAEWAERFVAGHGPHASVESFARFSYLPLPSIGGPHPDGMIRRALIAETAGGDGRSAAWVRQRLNGLALRNEKNDTDAACLQAVEAAGDGVFNAYTKPADRWQTITPVILPGFDDNHRGKRLKLLLRCFDQIGIPPELIADLDVQKSPWLRASAQTRSFDGKRSRRLEHLPACHVRVYFKHPVSGPMALGAGRHRGLGLLAAWD
jgi:CRISPR-associated protein Csb2